MFRKQLATRSKMPVERTHYVDGFPGLFLSLWLACQFASSSVRFHTISLLPFSPSTPPGTPFSTLGHSTFYLTFLLHLARMDEGHTRIAVVNPDRYVSSCALLGFLLTCPFTTRHGPVPSFLLIPAAATHGTYPFSGPTDPHILASVFMDMLAWYFPTLLPLALRPVPLLVAMSLAICE